MGELYLFVVALEQLDAQLFLQSLDLPAQRRLADVQVPRGGRNILVLSDIPEMVQHFYVHTPSPLSLVLFCVINTNRSTGESSQLNLS
jgi:hypothetical protein